MLKVWVSFQGINGAMQRLHVLWPDFLPTLPPWNSEHLKFCGEFCIVNVSDLRKIGFLSVDPFLFLGKPPTEQFRNVIPSSSLDGKLFTAEKMLLLYYPGVYYLSKTFFLLIFYIHMVSVIEVWKYQKRPHSDKQFWKHRCCCHERLSWLAWQFEESVREAITNPAPGMHQMEPNPEVLS